MFKRVAKRQRKREKEEELGLDEGMKQVLGLQDTDSDESFDSSSSGNDSDLDSDSGQESGDEDIGMGDGALRPSRNLKRKHSVEGSHSDFESSRDSGEGFAGVDPLASESGEDDMDNEDGPPMGVMAATTNPIYDVLGVPATQDLRACILCPGKLLKNSKMTKVHAESTAHLRRLQRYISYVSRLTSSPEGLTVDDPREILRDMALAQNSGPTGQSPDSRSKRSQRRNTWKAKQQERKKAKKQTKAKPSGEQVNKPDSSVDDNTGSEAAKKRRKQNKLVENRPGNSQIVPTFNLPATATQEQLPEKGRDRANKTGSTHEHIATDSSNRDRPRKRRKQEILLAVSSSADTRMDASQIHSKAAANKLSHRKPSLKRHDTSLYFADDEKHSGTSGKIDRNHESDESRIQKHVGSGSERKRRSEPRGEGGHIRTPARADKRDISQREKGDNKKFRGRNVSSGGRGKRRGLVGNALSPEQWESVKSLQIFD